MSEVAALNRREPLEDLADAADRGASAPQEPPPYLALAGSGRPPAQPQSTEVESIVRQLDPKKTVLIPAGVRFEGSISTDGKAAVVVYGQVDGGISAGEMPVFVAAGGAVKGVIENRAEIVVAGAVGSGDAAGACIRTSQRFVLGSSGRVDGDVMYGSMRIYDGIVAGRLLPFVADESAGH
jgi:cytoskeletal protein CcmA (bactofilin family)